MISIRSLPRALPMVPIARPCTSSAFPLRTTRSFSSTPSAILPKRRTISPLQTCLRCTQKRLNSTAPAVDAAATAAPKMATGEETLTWNRFLALRRTRRRLSLITSIACALATSTAGMVYMDSGAIDIMQFGLDPMFVLAIGFVGSAAAGWLLGPVFGNGVFSLYYRSIRGQIARKEKEFYNRIKKFRVDPSNSSMQNPVPDYYGEKIGSVAGYRRWLKDQRAFNLKRGKTV